MSTAYGIAAVTAVMREMLTRRLADAKAGGIVDAGTKVTARPPDRVSVTNGGESCLNLFLYEVLPNTGWVNEDLRSRGADGRLVSTPMLALDLQYLLSAYGTDDMEAEILLGHAMQTFHESPGMSRAAIRKVFDPAPPDDPGRLPRAFRERAMPLADQIELIKISPRYLKTEEMSRIWTSLSAHYRPSIVYQATVVLIESNKTVRSAPPVLARGAGDRGPGVEPSLLPPFPTLLGVRLPDHQPAVLANDTIELFGHHLEGDSLVVRFENSRLGLTVEASGAALTSKAPDLSSEELNDNPRLRLASTCIEVDLAQAAPANAWAAGAYRIEVDVVRPGEVTPRTSNALGVAVAPSFATAGANKPKVVVGANNAVTITLTCSPEVLPRQKASLVVRDQELVAAPLTVAGASVVFRGTLPAEMLAAGAAHLARLRVDGVDSLYIKQNQKPQPPEFDPTQRITMP